MAWTTWAPRSRATSTLPSVEPLSATIARTCSGSRDRIHGRPAASSKHGSTNVTSVLSGTPVTIAYAHSVSASLPDLPELRPRVWPIALWLLAMVAVAWWGYWLEDTGQQDLVLFGTQPFLGGPLEPKVEFLLLPAAAAVAGVVLLPVTNDIPLAARVLEKGAEAISPTAKVFTSDMIGSALATRGLMEHLRSFGEITSGPKPFSVKDRSAFLSALDAAINRAKKKTV